MSTQSNGRHVSPSRDPNSLTTPKKRKHRAEEKESSKKKKKPRTEEPSPKPAEIESSAATAVASQSQKSQDGGSKKKKKSKDKKKDPEAGTESAPIKVTQSEPGDIELEDAPSPEAESSTEAQPLAASPTALNGEDGAAEEMEMVPDLLDSADPTSFYSTRLSLYLSVPAIALEAGSSSVLATHLAPLLLTYFPPAQGIVLGFSDPVLSARPDTGINRPLLPPSSGDLEAQAEVLAKTADELGVCWVWLTATFLVFRPERGDELYGWTNVTSEGFVGLVSYNYFQTAVAQNRIPSDWTWSGPSKEEDGRKNKKKGKKGRLRDEHGSSSQVHGDENEGVASTQDGDPDAVHQAGIGDDAGFFVDATGTKIEPTQKFRVVDTEIVPAHDRHKWSLQIEGTLLDEEAEQRVVEEERAKFELAQHRSRSHTPGGDNTPGLLMTGALARSREGSVASRLSGPIPSQRHRVAY